MLFTFVAAGLVYSSTASEVVYTLDAIWPHSAGTSWAYQSDTGAEMRICIVESAFLADGTSKSVKLSTTFKPTTPRVNEKSHAFIDAILIKSGEVSIVSTDGEAAVPPDTFLRMPIYPNLTWMKSSKHNNRDTIRYKVMPRIAMDTAYGRLNLLPIESTTTSGGVGIVKTSWYSEGLGLVKFKTSLQGSLGVTWSLESTSLKLK
jgi:hypothetical protein